MAYRSSSTNTGNSATPSTAVPVGVAADDIVILVASIDAAAAAFDPADWPAGFTELSEVGLTLDGQRAAVGWKRPTGADTGSYTFGTLGVSGVWVCEAFAFSGRDTTNPPVVSTAATNNTANANPVTITANGVTAVAGDDLLWMSAPDVNATGIGNGHTPPAGYTERQDTELTFSNLSGATKDNASAGATGSVSGSFALTSGGSGWAAWLIRIPVAGGGATPVDLGTVTASTVLIATAAATAATAVTPAPSTASFTASATVTTSSAVDLGTVTATAAFASTAAATATAVTTPAAATAAFTATATASAATVVSAAAAAQFAAAAAVIAPTGVTPAAAPSVYGASAVVTTPGTPTATSRLPLVGVGT